MLAVVVFAMLFAVLLSVGIGVVCFLSVACRPSPLETVEETQPSRLFDPSGLMSAHESALDHSAPVYRTMSV